MMKNEKMLQHEMYDANYEGEMCYEDNQLYSSDEKRRKELLQRMLGQTRGKGHPGQFSSCW